MDRREFISTGMATAASTIFGAAEIADGKVVGKRPIDQLVWGVRYNLGLDDQRGDTDPFNPNFRFAGENPHMKPFDETEFWYRVKAAKAAGVNTFIVATMEGLKYPSHPEIAAPYAIEPEKLSEIVKTTWEKYRIRMIPKLNFSTCHGNWMGIYSRMISTPQYYQFVKDVIKDVVDIFGHPKIVDFGMDEESPDHRGKNFTVVRSGKLYWHDNNMVVDEIEKHGARAMCDADKWWWGGKEVCDNLPKSVILLNWYYSDAFSEEEIRRRAKMAGDEKLGNQFVGYFRTFAAIEEAGYDQIPCGSWWFDRLDKAARMNADETCARNLPEMVRYCTKAISPKRLRGFFMTQWSDGNCAHRFWDRLMGPIAEARKVYAQA